MDTFEYIRTLSKFREEIPANLRPSWVQITTITMFSKNLLNGLDMNRIRKAFHKLEVIPVRPKGSKYLFEWRLKPNSFYNQLTIGYTDCYSTKSVKLFSNGSVQVAGCSNILDCKRVIAQLKVILETIMDKDLDITFDKFKVVMINTNFSVNYSLHIYNIIRKLSAQPMFDVTYEPGTYAAVKVKFQPKPGMKHVTTNIFSTGNIIITGAENLMEVAHAYKIINANLTEDVRIQAVAEPKLFNTILGSTFEEWLRIFGNKI